MNSGKLRLLIADDDDGDRMQLRRLIRACGLVCEIDDAMDLKEAEAACAAHLYDCAIIDYRMPGGNGLKGIVALRDQHPHLPIIMVTGQGDELIASEAIKLGAADYVPKSQLSESYLAHVIQNALRKAELERIVADQREELERFGQVLAHDLKTPIHQIRYLLQFIERDLDEDNREQLSVNRDRLLATARRMEDLINTLQHYTMSDKPIEVSVIPLDGAVEGCLSNLAGEIAARDAEITCGRLPLARGNLSLLTQLFQNLVGNSLKYCGAARPEVSIAAETDGEMITVSIADNGIGVPPAQQHMIFQPFSRLHRQSEIEGTGLGLAICRKIVERHGGRIWCEGRPSGGSIFRFTLSAA
ncbi:sensor histidine kinase [Rhizobium sp. C4]|uniref:sensor histidine kinase n=1 Tax=Rhizobium sp. C4 TaxID=1349800 RepID=UPI001E4ECBC0|nr:hybrid sensor histidine kinase/response regulator [Rhizobium sp. C4]MCD2173127.1 ATP-binding protein [Rhizobium sp. C4]